MTIQELIGLLENKLSYTQAQHISAIQRGDIELVEKLNQEIVNTQSTLDQLRTLL